MTCRLLLEIPKNRVEIVTLSKISKMDLTKILAISGKPGLYKMLSQTKSGFIVESLADGKRFPVFAHERISSLEEISIFTTGEEDIQLKEAFRKIYDKMEGKPGPDPKASPEEVVRFFEETLPEYDAERVYASDMKKAIAWYNTLLENSMLDFTEEESEKETGTGDDKEQAEGSPEGDVLKDQPES